MFICPVDQAAYDKILETEDTAENYYYASDDLIEWEESIIR